MGRIGDPEAQVPAREARVGFSPCRWLGLSPQVPWGEEAYPQVEDWAMNRDVDGGAPARKTCRI